MHHNDAAFLALIVSSLKERTRPPWEAVLGSGPAPSPGLNSAPHAARRRALGSAFQKRGRVVMCPRSLGRGWVAPHSSNEGRSAARSADQEPDGIGEHKDGSW